MPRAASANRRPEREPADDIALPIGARLGQHPVDAQLNKLINFSSLVEQFFNEINEYR